MLELINQWQAMLLYTNRNCSCENAQRIKKNRPLLCMTYPPSVLLDSTNKYLIPQNKQQLKKKKEYTYNAPRATKPSTLRGSMLSALLRHWKASECLPDLKCSMPSATLLKAHLLAWTWRSSNAYSCSGNLPLKQFKILLLICLKKYKFTIL